MSKDGKSVGLIMGLGGGGSDEGSEKLAARALMRAIRSGDPSAVVDAFHELSAACGYSRASSEPDEEDNDEEM